MGPIKKETRKLVNFIICGTQKGGTTALYRYLKNHPEICLANIKEVHFFDNDNYFVWGQPDFSIYHAYFNYKESDKLLGEATPVYMYWYNSPRRIWEYNPDIKLIVLLRNPIERAFSHWNMERSRSADLCSFWDAIKNESKRCRESLPDQHRVYSYIDRGFYLEQLRRLWHFFPKEQILILKNDFLKQQPTKALHEICAFLGITQLVDNTFEWVNNYPYINSMNEKERDYLKLVFEYEIKELERVLSWDCSDWLADKKIQ